MAEYLWLETQTEVCCYVDARHDHCCPCTEHWCGEPCCRPERDAGSESAGVRVERNRNGVVPSGVADSDIHGGRISRQGRELVRSESADDSGDHLPLRLALPASAGRG